MDLAVALATIADHMGIETEDVKAALAPIGCNRAENSRQEWLRLCRQSVRGFCGKGTVINFDRGEITEIQMSTSLKSLDKLIGVENGGGR